MNGGEGHLDCVRFVRMERQAIGPHPPLAEWVPPGVSQRKPLPLAETARKVWRWIQSEGKSHLAARHRRIRVKETTSLGEKRFLSIVEVDGRSYLIGGGTAGVSVLTPLPATPDAGTEFGHVLEKAQQEGVR